MDNKKTNIALAVVLVLIVGLIVFMYLSKQKNDEKNSSYEPDYNVQENVNYSAGEYRFISVSEQDLVIKYYKKFINTLKNDKKAAWDMIDKKCKENKFNSSYEEFEKFVNKYLITAKMDEYSVVKYDYDYKERKNTISIVDSQDFLYKFYEKSVWNFKVEILSKIK